MSDCIGEVLIPEDTTSRRLRLRSLSAEVLIY